MSIKSKSNCEHQRPLEFDHGLTRFPVSSRAADARASRVLQGLFAVGLTSQRRVVN